MRKLVVFFISLLLMVGCSNSPIQENEIVDISELKVISPTGAPALALLDLFPVLNEGNLVTVDGSDVLQAAFVNPESEYDVIIAPTNLGAKLASLQKTNYKLASVVTWGNLFILGSDEADLNNSECKLAAFGETAVPGLVFNSVLEQLNIQAEITWYGSVQEAQAALLSKNADAALIAEPAATATIAKAKKDLGLELKVIKDIQSAWQDKTGYEGYPQASIFVLENSYVEKSEAIDALLAQVNQTLTNGNDSINQEKLVKQIDEYKDALGTPAGNVVSKAYAGMNLNYRPAQEVKAELQAFLELFGIKEIDNIFLK